MNAPRTTKTIGGDCLFCFFIWPLGTRGTDRAQIPEFPSTSLVANTRSSPMNRVLLKSFVFTPRSLHVIFQHGGCQALLQCRGNHLIFPTKWWSCFVILNPSYPMSNSNHVQVCIFIKIKKAFLKASLHLTVSKQEIIAARCFNANNYLSCCPLSSGSVAPTANDREYSRVALMQSILP